VASGPWSPCSAAAGLTLPYLGHLDRTEDGFDPAAEAEIAYVTEQFHLSWMRDSGSPGPTCRYVPLPNPLPSPFRGRPYVGAYVDDAPAHGERDGPAGGMLLVTGDGEGADFLRAYRDLNRNTALWWAPGEDATDMIGRLDRADPARVAARAILDAPRAAVRTRS
jgi:hypothetical protein